MARLSPWIRALRALLVVAALCGLVVAWIFLDPDPARRAAVVALSDDYAEAPKGPVTRVASEPADIGVGLDRVATGIQQPTDVQFPPARSDVAIVLEKTGKARWLDVASGAHGVLFEVEVRTASEEGLLGLAFHPRFSENGRFFLNYVVEHDGEDVSRVAEWTFAEPADLKRGKATERKVLMEVVQPYANHDAGQLAFGPDGYLYVGWGDGGFRDDPRNAGQDPDTLLGKMLRIDVDRQAAGKSYAIPGDNPFVGKAGYRPEIWALGLRNPWR